MTSPANFLEAYVKRFALVLALAVLVAACGQVAPVAPSAPESLLPAAGLAAAPSLQPVPIKGTCDTVITPLGIIGPETAPRFNMLVDGHCQVSHLGVTTLHAEQAALLVPNFGLTGEFIMTAANGDTLRVIERDDAFGVPDPQDPTRVVLSGHSHFDGGTGRFAGATGEFTLNGWASLATNVGHYEFEGTIVYDASNRAVR